MDRVYSNSPWVLNKFEVQGEHLGIFVMFLKLFLSSFWGVVNHNELLGGAMRGVFGLQQCLSWWYLSK